MDRKLEGKNAIVTGGSRGLGRAIAAALWREGASLLLVSRTRTPWTEARDGSQSVLMMTADLVDPDAPRRVFNEAQRRWRKLDVLVNAAGVLGPVGPFLAADGEEWTKSFQVNFHAPLDFCRRAASWMQETGGGSIINVADLAVCRARPRFTAYASAKAALMRFSDSLAGEVAGAGIRVNCVAPGDLSTAMTRDIIEAGAELAGDPEYRRALALLETGGAPLDKSAELCVFLAGREGARWNGRLLCPGDPWQDAPARDDVFTLGRITG